MCASTRLRGRGRGRDNHNTDRLFIGRIISSPTSGGIHPYNKALTVTQGQPLSYNRIGKRITTTINPNNKVVTCRPVSDKEIRDFKLKKESRNTLSKIQKDKFTAKAKEEAKNCC